MKMLRTVHGMLFAACLLPLVFAGCGPASSTSAPTTAKQEPKGEPKADTEVPEYKNLPSGPDQPAPPKSFAGEAPAANRKDWPSEAEVKSTILKIEFDIYASDTNKKIWKVKDFKHDVKSIKYGVAPIQRQMRVGQQMVTTYPVQVLYTQITDYEHKATTKVECGDDGVWYFYRDSLGGWTAKYGNK